MSPVDDRSTQRLRIRMAAMVGLPLLLAVGVLAKVVVLQRVQGAELRAKYEAQHRSEFKLRSQRGSVRDRTGRLLAGTVLVDSVYIRPKQVEDPAAALDLLAPALGRPRSEIGRKLRSKRPFVWLARHAEPALAERLRALQVGPGIGFEREPKRFWPQGSLAGQLLGFTDIDGVGRAGVERAYERTLAPRTVRVRGLRDSRRRAIYTDGLSNAHEAQAQDLTLAIDSVLQQVAEEELRHAVEVHGAKQGVVVMLAARTGDILAMASVPQFDPNGRRKVPAEYRNRAVTDVYEPGSVLKVLTLAAALDVGVVRLTTPIDCEKGRYRIGRHVIHDHAPEKILTAKEVITVSSNIGIAKIAERLGKERLHRALRSFGFGQRTKANGLSGEVAGLLSRPKRWPAIQLANIAFGQGVAVTALQLASSLQVVANGGERMQPRLVTSINDVDGRVLEEFPPRSLGQVISPAAARATTEAMVSVVNDEEGTGSRARVPGFAVAGKTGTAQKVDPKLRAYVDKWIGSFAGFVPANRPEIVLVVSIDEPEPDHYGGLVAAPAFATIAGRALAHLGVYGRPEPKPEPKRKAARRRRRRRRRLRARGRAVEGAVVKEMPGGDGEQQGAGPIDEGPRVPSFAGLTLRAALAVAEQHELMLRPEGSGRAVWQGLKAGDRLEPGAECPVRFAGLRKEQP